MGGQLNTIRVDSKVVAETDTGEAKDLESAWMRATLEVARKYLLFVAGITWIDTSLKNGRHNVRIEELSS